MKIKAGYFELIKEWRLKKFIESFVLKSTKYLRGTLHSRWVYLITKFTCLGTGDQWTLVVRNSILPHTKLISYYIVNPNKKSYENTIYYILNTLSEQMYFCHVSFYLRNIFYMIWQNHIHEIQTWQKHNYITDKSTTVVFLPVVLLLGSHFVRMIGISKNLLINYHLFLHSLFIVSTKGLSNIDYKSFKG